MVQYTEDLINYSRFRDLPGAVYTRSGVAYQQNASGTWVPFDENVPPTSAGVGLGVWEARTNLLLQSSDFDSVTWIKSRGTVSANAIAAPNGVVSGDKFSEDSANGTHRVYETVTKSASAVQYTASCYFKAAERTFAQIRVAEAGETNASGVAINLTTGEVGTPYGAFSNMSARSTPATDGWFRLEFTFTTLTDASIVTFLLTALNLSSTTPAFVGTPGSGVYVWGAQLEVGAFATPYIPTTTAAATRGAPSMYLNAPGLIVPALGVTVVAEVEWPRYTNASAVFVEPWNAGGGSPAGFTLSADSGGNRPRIVLRQGSGRFDTGSNANVVVAGATVKFGLSFDAVGGVASSQGQSVNSSFTPSQSDYAGEPIYFGSRAGASNFANTNIRKVQFLQGLRTQAELNALTA